MHGRLKVKTTAQQEEAKRKEREKKLKLYNAGTSAAFNKRKAGQYDEEGLKYTGEILSVNPDFYSLWNYRKEIFLHIKETRQTEEIKKLMHDELGFLESCLKVNPKSYGAWQHRCFIMENMPEADWERELHLCNTFLEYDERNFHSQDYRELVPCFRESEGPKVQFTQVSNVAHGPLVCFAVHCWDYRRFVVLMSEVDLEAELGYTTQKIQSNFSNYSSWHYRSKLLPMIYPDPTNPVRVQEDILLQEHETVQNAIFTDPDDQSAWFYHRWLLGRGRKKLQISCVHFSRQTKNITVLLTSHIKVDYGHKLTVTINGETASSVWRNVKGGTNYDIIWITTLTDDLPDDKDLSVAVTLLTETDSTQFSQGLQIDGDQQEAWVMAEYKTGSRFSVELSAAATTTLEKELEGIQELHNVEPENKWVLLTLLYLMKAIDPLHEKYENDITMVIDKLKAVDCKRTAFYQDLRSKFIMEKILDSQDVNIREMRLCDLGLTSICHTEWMCLIQDLDISHNSVSSLKPLSNLPCLKILKADSNKITSTEGLQHCKELKSLSLQKNEISSVEVLRNLKSLTITEINLAGNPVCNKENYLSLLHNLLPSLPQNPS